MLNTWGGGLFKLPILCLMMKNCAKQLIKKFLAHNNKENSIGDPLKLYFKMSNSTSVKFFDIKLGKKGYKAIYCYFFVIAIFL